MKELTITKDNGTTHRLINEDFLKVKGLCVNVIINDPPFGVTAQQWDKVVDFEEMWKWLEETKRDKNHTPVIMFSSAKFTPQLQMSNFKDYKYSWIWKKNIATNFLNAKKMPLRAVENVNVFYKKLPYYNPQKSEGHSPTNSAKGRSRGNLYHGEDMREYVGGDTTRFPTELLEFDVVKDKHRIHSNQKPLELLRYLIRTYTKEGDTVLDFTAGSMSLAVACYLEGRNSICIEMDTEQFNKSVEWVKHCSFEDNYKTKE